MTNPSNPNERIITVIGTGSANLAPDHAVVQWGVRVVVETAQSAMQQCAKAMQALVATIKSAGVSDRHIRTGTLNLTPEYRSAPDGTTTRIGNSALGVALPQPARMTNLLETDTPTCA